MDKTQDGGYKIRSRMILFKKGVATALCPTCKTPVSVPLALGTIGASLPKQKLVINS